MLLPSYEKIFSIPTEQGSLEAIVTQPQALEQPRALAVVCHPNPLEEGTMHNKVVTTLVRVFRQLGCVVCRFNMRGVGNSSGVYGHFTGECEDLDTVIDWMKTQQGHDLPLWLAGFSFGGSVAAAGAAKWKPQGLVCAAPSVEKNRIAPESIEVPTWVAWGDADDVVDPQAIESWAEAVEQLQDVIPLPGVSHFFHGALITLRDELLEKLAGKVGA